MENENIIIILVVIAVILACAVGLMYLKTTNAKPTEIRITSNETLNKGDSLTIQLTDLNKTAISENVSIVIKNTDGAVVVTGTVSTNSKGLANFDLDLEKGEYTVNVTFNGNNNFTGSNATQKLTIKEAVTESIGDSSSSGYTTEPVYDAHTISYKDGVRGVYSKSGEFFIDPTQDPSYRYL